MEIKVDVYHHFSDATADAKLNAILNLLTESKGRELDMSKELDALKTEVERVKTIDESAVTLIKGLSDQIVALKDDPAALQALADELKLKTDGFASALQTYTPAPPTPPTT